MRIWLDFHGRFSKKMYTTKLAAQSLLFNKFKQEAIKIYFAMNPRISIRSVKTKNSR
jgi:hypothetical protein